MTFSVQLHPPTTGDQRFTAEVLLRGERVHRDRLNPDSEFERGKFLDGLARRVALDDAQRRALNQQLMFAAPIGASPDCAWQPLVKRLAEISLATTRWLREPWYPLGAYTDVSGDPGTGKSQLLCELTAEVTSSGGDVLILSAEDAAETTLKPRLVALGADCQAVHVLSFVRAGADGEPVPVNLVEHLDAFRAAVENVRPRLVWIDTIDAHAAGINLNANTEVRGYLLPLVKLAELHRFALVGIRHWNKKAGQSALYKGAGSVAIVAAARSAIVVGPHPAEPGCYVQASAKLNIAQRPRARRTASRGRSFTATTASRSPPAASCGPAPCRSPPTS